MKTKRDKKYNELLDGKLRYVMPIALVVIAGAFIVYGVYDKEVAAVFSKAVALCRQCVGIG